MDHDSFPGPHSGNAKSVIVTGFITVAAVLAGILFSVPKLNSNSLDIYQISDYDKHEVFLKTRLPNSQATVASARSSDERFQLEIPVASREHAKVWLLGFLPGSINVEIGDRDFQVTSDRQDASRHFRLHEIGELAIKRGNSVNLVGLTQPELALGYLIVSSLEYTDDNVVTQVLNGNPDHGSDIGLLLVVLSLTFAALWMLNRQISLSVIQENHYRGASAMLLLTLLSLVLSYHFAEGPSPLEPMKDKRVGVERIINDGTNTLLAGTSNVLTKVLPNRIVIDDVPVRLRKDIATVTSRLYVTDTPGDFPAVSQQLLGGYLTKIQDQNWPQFRVTAGMLLILILILMLIPNTATHPGISVAALTVISMLSILCSIRLSYGWDEFYINLRHAWMLLEHGVYSVNADELVEASVDTLPLLVTALLGFFGLSLPTAFIVTSLTGNLLVVVFSFLISMAVTGNRSWSVVVALVVGCHPNILWIGATGFSTGLFVGSMLAAVYFLLFSKRRSIGLVVLSLLTLIRTEGVMFAAMLMAYTHIIASWPKSGAEWQPFLKRAFVEGGLVASPFLVSCLVRLWTYGSPLPTPMTFKNPGFDLSYAQQGLYRLSEMISLHDLHMMYFLIAISGIVLLLHLPKVSSGYTYVHKLLALTIISFLFIIPYHLGGGDWFPSSWNRHGQTATVFAMMSMLILLCMTVTRLLTFQAPVWGQASVYLLILVIGVGIYQESRFRPGSIYRVTANHLVTPAEIFWTRVDELAQLGFFMKDYLPADAVVASPEEAAIMYHSEHKMLGLLGISDPDIASAPLQPMKPGDILHRKRAHRSVFQNRPDVIAIREAFWHGDNSTPELIHRNVRTQLFSQFNVDVAYARIGSFAGLAAMGYEHVSIAFSDRVYGFFVNGRVATHLDQRLTADGFRQSGKIDVPYRVAPYLTERYLPAVPEIVDQL